MGRPNIRLEQAAEKPHGVLQVFDRPCKNCLYGPSPVVSKRRVAEIRRGLATGGGHFICHVASMAGEKDVACARYLTSPEAGSNIALRLVRKYPDQLLQVVIQPVDAGLPRLVRSADERDDGGDE